MPNKIPRKLWVLGKKKLRLERSEESIATTIENISKGANLSGVYFWVLVGAIFIASLGLNVNSTAVVIGAMLISPLMGPIMGVGLGLGISDMPMVRKASRNFLVMVAVGLFTSFVYFFLSPFKESGSELLARTSPTIYDVLIAIFGGLTGILAGSSTQLRNSNVIPGVAIATALMPPLCTAGYGLATWNLVYFFGAMYLFFINCIFISLSTYLVVRLLRFPHAKFIEETVKIRRFRIFIWTVVILFIVPSIYFTYDIIQKFVFEKNANSFIKKEVETKDRFILSPHIKYKRGNNLIDFIVLGDAMDSIEMVELKNKLPDYGLYKTELLIQQGGDIQEIGKSITDQVSKGIKVNTQSIQYLYNKVDSLHSVLLKYEIIDSLQVYIGRQAKNWVPEIKSFALNYRHDYNIEEDKKDTVWQVRMAFSKYVPRSKIKSLEDSIRLRLNGSEVNFTIAR
jgi:uncharacterized hydrophobic protein (TIGR00271 family)